MKYTDVELSDGQKARVRRLGLFEIDDIPKDIPGPYKYTVHLFGGDDYEIEYDLKEAATSPPVKPSIPVDQAEAGNPEYYQWQEWLRFEEAKAHQVKAYEAYAAYCERVADYIRANCLMGLRFSFSYNGIIQLLRFLLVSVWILLTTRRLRPRNERIASADDWQLIYHAALCPQVGIDDIRQAMGQTFGARWAGKELFDAIANVDGSPGEYISTKVWETDLMIKLGETEAAYTERSITERARMIAALKIPQFFSILETDKAIKEAKTKGG